MVATYKSQFMVVILLQIRTSFTLVVHPLNYYIYMGEKTQSSVIYFIISKENKLFILLDNVSVMLS